MLACAIVMALMASPFDTHSSRVQAMIQQEIQKIKTVQDPQWAPPAPVAPLSPQAVSIMGGLLDALSTYRFLKRGTTTEDNALVSGMHNSPAQVGGLGLAMVPAIQLLGKLLRKTAPRIADALEANQGALQLGYGLYNLHYRGDSSSSLYSDAMQHEIARETQRQLGFPVY